MELTLNSAWPKSTRAFARRELLAMVAAVFILGLLLLAWGGRGRRESDRTGCAHQLKHIGLAFNLWAGDHEGLFPMSYYALDREAAEPKFKPDVLFCFQVLSNELRAPDIVSCPAGLPRHYATNFTTDFTAKQLGYFAGLDADRAHPAAFLAGDKNLAGGAKEVGGKLNLVARQAGWAGGIHGGGGNVVLVNGGVLQLNNRHLREALAETGFGTNRLVMPEGSP